MIYLHALIWLPTWSIINTRLLELLLKIPTGKTRLVAVELSVRVNLIWQSRNWIFSQSFRLHQRAIPCINLHKFFEKTFPEDFCLTTSLIYSEVRLDAARWTQELSGTWQIMSANAFISMEMDSFMEFRYIIHNSLSTESINQKPIIHGEL